MRVLVFMGSTAGSSERGSDHSDGGRAELVRSVVERPIPLDHFGPKVVLCRGRHYHRLSVFTRGYWSARSLVWVVKLIRRSGFG